MTYFAADTTYQKWYVTKITDRNGNWINISYDNFNDNGATITSVSTSDGRSLTYSYDTIIDSYKRLSSITDGTRTWRYAYIDNTTPGFSGLSVGTFLLNKVTLPDNTFWEYTYNGNLGTAAGSYQINSVTTPQLGKVTYTYSFVNFIAAIGRLPDEVISSRSIAGVGSWSYSYVPGTNVGELDTTTVTAPGNLQKIVYKHYGQNAILTAGDIWKIGLLAEKTVGTVQSESYSWTPLQISNQNDTRTFTWVPIGTYFYAPRLSSKTITRDGATYSTTFSGFDSYNNPGVVAEVGPNGETRTTNVTYNNTDAATKWVLHQVKNETVVGGKSTTRQFDADHNLQSITVDGVTTSYTYKPNVTNGTENGTIATMTLPRPSQTHSYSDYKRGIPQTENQPEGITINRIVSDAGTVLSVTNGRRYTTSYTYDGLNRLKTITYPAGHNFVRIDYNTATSKTATRGDLVEHTTYDGFGRPESVTLGGIQTTYHYDPLGRMDFKSNPGSTLGTRYSYDALDRVKTITYADNSFKSYTYDAATTSIQDERKNTTTYAYRAYGDPDKTFLMQINAPVSAANIAITRTTRDQIESVRQGTTLTRGYFYYPTGYLKTVTDPEIGTTTYGRDEAGNMTTRSVGTSGTTIYAYDLQNRLKDVTYPGTTPPIHHTYTYTNKLKTVSAGASTRILDYDATDNLISDVLSIDGHNFSAGYGYNTNDQLSTLTYPQSGKTVSFSPDVLGRPTGATAYASNVTYWPSGQVKQISYQNGTVSNYDQKSDRLWPKSFTTQKAGSTPYVNNTYEYDFGGNLKTITDTNNPDFNRSFDYDAINRLTTINGPWGPGIIDYDGVGNIQRQTYGTTGLTYTYSPQKNQLTTVSGLRNTSYTYDTSFGNITGDGAGKSYGYDDAPNLTSINDSNTGTAISYTYDGLSKRTKVIKNGVTTYEFYDFSGKLLTEYTPGTPNNLVEYIYLGNMRIAQRMSYQ
ncbi:MAG: RHS repeat protein [Gammaproteobacteria bacterium]|nr:RHS repeat protein [Gammaproteobacteria bacterium]MBU1482167.1 RHS repeat protein [Gammaproteobacteria bacterium]